MKSRKENELGVFEATNMNVVYTEEDMEPDSEECRICLEPKTSTEPLIIACKCIGSVKFVHAGCLKEWVQRQYADKQRKIECELCKFPLAFSIDKIKECNSR